MAVAGTELSKNHHRIRQMFGSIAARYDVGNTVLSMGIHHLWRRKLLARIPVFQRKAHILDVCTGTGDLLVPLLSKFPEAEVYGADFCFPMLEEAVKKTDVGKTPVFQADALQMPFVSDSFDVITVAFGVRNFESTEAGLKELYRILKPGGTLLVLEFGQPGGLFGVFYRFYSKHIMPIIGGLVTGNKQAYQYLPQTAASFPSGSAFCELLNRTGFAQCESSNLTFGIACIYRGIKS